MANTANIQIYRSYANTAPTILKDGQLAYSFVSNKLFIGSNNTVVTIGGRYYANAVDFATSSITANTLVKRDAYGGARFQWLSVDNAPFQANSVVNKAYVDESLLGSYGSIYYGTQGQPFYSNVLTSSIGVDITANNTHIAEYRDYAIVFNTNLYTLGNTYTNYIFAGGQVDGEEFHANTKILVGQASRTSIQLPNSIATLSANSEYYVQVNAQNLNGNGSADIVVTADVGTDVDYYVDMGMGGSTYSYYTGNNSPMEPLAGYLLVQGSTLGLPGGNLVIGTTSPKTKITFMAGGYETDNIQMTMSNSGVNIWHTLTATEIVSPTVNAITSNIANSFVYTNTANTFLQANDSITLNSAKSYTNTANTFLQANDSITLSAAKEYANTTNNWLRDYTDIASTFNQEWTNEANTWLQANTGAGLIEANTWLQANDATTLASAKAYTDTANTFLKLFVNSEISSNLNTAEAYTDTANNKLRLYTDFNITANAQTAKTYTDTANTFNINYSNGNLNTALDYTNTANTFLQANDATTLAVAKNYTDIANGWLQGNIFNTLTTSKNYTDTANTFNQANTGAGLIGANNYTDTANTNLRLYVDGKVSSNLLLAYANTGTANIIAVSASSYANGAFQAANSAGSYANSSFLQANTGNLTANAAYSFANTSNAYFYGVNAYQNNFITTANNTANAAYAFANAACEFANTANVLIAGINLYQNTFITTANNTANAAYAFANTTNSYFYGVNAVQNTDVSIISSYANGAYQYANSAGSYANSGYQTANSGSSYANGAFQAANSAGSYANSAYLAQNTSGVYANTALQYANSAGSYANSAYATANLKLNSSGGDIAFINVASNVSVGNSIDFDVTKPESSWKEGRLWYDKYSKALAYFNDTSGYIHIGMDSVIRVWNNTGSTIPAVKALYISGPSSANGVLSVALANAISQSTSEVIGLSQRDIPAGAYGLAVKNGVIEYQDTSALTSGQQFYLSDTVPGGLTLTPPAPPAVPLQLAYVTNISPTYGEYIVDIHLMEGINKTSGAILFARDNAIDQDPNDLYWDYANNSLGIGTNEPAANLHVVGSGLFTGNVTISGNLLVSNAQAITTTELTVGGNTIILNSEATGVPTSNASIIVNRGSETNVYITWDESINEWIMYEASGIPGHILHSEKTAHTWADYTAMPAYEKLTHPIGADLANATNEIAKSSYVTANIAYYNALSGYIHANSAYVSQNTTGVYANTAYIHANSAHQYANSSGSYANGAFQAANSAGSYANSAYLQSNAHNTFANSTFLTSANGTIIGTYANGAYQYANSAGSYANSAFGVANNAFTSSNGAIAWNTANAASSYANSAYLSQNTTGVYANTALQYANSAGSYANSAYVNQNTTGIYANTALQYANSAGSYANSGLQYANSAGSYANSAYLQANTVTQFANNGSFTTSSTLEVAVDSWSAATYRSATYQLQLASGSSYHVLDIKLMHDGTNVWWNGYGELWNNSRLATFSGTITGGNVQLLITPVNSVTSVKFVKSLINT